MEGGDQREAGGWLAVRVGEANLSRMDRLITGRLKAMVSGGRTLPDELKTLAAFLPRPETTACCTLPTPGVPGSVRGAPPGALSGLGGSETNGVDVGSR
jgi:hypothetical protein